MLKNNIISKKALLYPLLMLAAMWLGFFLQMQGFFQSCFGAIIPLLPEGLLGIITSPLLHGNMEHIVGNSIPIVVLMFLLYQFQHLREIQSLHFLAQMGIQGLVCGYE